MAILDSVKKVIPFQNTDDGYEKVILSSQAIEMDDGSSLEEATDNLESSIGYLSGEVSANEGRLQELNESLINKQDLLEFDTFPINESSNPITSGGVYAALEDKQDLLDFDSVPTDGSSNPVTSGGVYSMLSELQYSDFISDPVAYFTVTEDGEDAPNHNGGGNTEWVLAPPSINRNQYLWLSHKFTLNNGGVVWTTPCVIDHCDPDIGTKTIGSSTQPVYVNNGILTPVDDALEISYGGTGATTASDARSNLGTGEGVFFATCSTSASETNKEVTTNSDGFKLRDGVVVIAFFSFGNTAAQIRLNVNNTGAYKVYDPLLEDTAPDSTFSESCSTCEFVYHASWGCWEFVGREARKSLLCEKLGTSTVGGTATPIYLNNGSPVKFESTIGSNANPVWISSGTITACANTIGGSANPVWMNSGVITSCSNTVGSGTKPVYMDSGTIKVSSSNVGDDNKPVYLSGGTITALSDTQGSSSKPVYLNAGAIVSCSSTVGSTTQPVYMNAGTISAMSGALALAYGGTGNTSGTATLCTTTSDTSNALYPVGVTSSATTTLKRDTSVTFNGGAITASSLTASGAVNAGAISTLTKSSGDTYWRSYRSDTDVGVWMGVGSGGSNHGLYSQVLGEWLVYCDGEDVYLNGKATTSGTATSADRTRYIAYNSTNYVAYATSSLNFVPYTDEGGSCGSGNNRWKAIYATNTTIQTSDINEKTEIADIDEQYEELFMKLHPVNYMWKNFTETDDHDRVHCGLIAQEVEKSCEEVGLSSMTFAALCRDDLEEPSVDGRTERYGIGYGELHGLEIHMIQKQEKEIKDLKSALDNALNTITSLEAKIEALG